MTGFYLTFIAVMISGLGGRDQALVAGLTAAQGRRLALLIAGIAAACATAGVAAWAGAEIAPLLPPRARTLLAAMALCLAGAESLVFTPRARPQEPTRSLGAAFLALVVLQAADAARFLVFAIAIATHAPVPAGLAGAIGGGALITLGWSLPHLAGSRWLPPARRSVGIALLLAGLIAGLGALELL